MGWRSRPVFISGTFRDMHRDRDAIVSQVFPNLEEEAFRLRTHLERIDLRFGVDTRSVRHDHAKQELVLKVCLEDVRRSRPFLIVLIGDRYGWVPPQARAQAATREIGFSTDVDRKSITALEIEFGLWGDAQQPARSLVYFRTLADEGMDEAQAIAHSDARAAVSNLLPPEERAAAAARAWRLAELKERLRADPAIGPNCRSYTAFWDPVTGRIAGLDGLAAMVEADLRALLAREAEEQQARITSGQVPDALEQYVEERASGFAGRREVVESLMNVFSSRATTPKSVLVLTGGSGAGKSAVFARLYQELVKTNVWVLGHSAEMSPGARSVESMLEAWNERLATWLRSSGSNVASSNTVPEERFAELLPQASALRPVVMLVDALDRFDGGARAERVTWLMKPLPRNVRLFMTATRGTQTHALEPRPDTAIMPLPYLSPDEASEVAHAVFARYHRQVDSDVVRTLVEKLGVGGRPCSRWPLWISVAADELNLLDADDFGRAEAESSDAETALHELLIREATRTPSEMEDLYLPVFVRLAEKHSPALVNAFLAILGVSRAGLREHDLSHLVPVVASELGLSAIPLAWDALSFGLLRRGLRAHLVRRGEEGRWDFRHTQARDAVGRAFLQTNASVQGLHRILVVHLQVQPLDDPLQSSELMYHLILADERDAAARLLATAEGPALRFAVEDLTDRAQTAEGASWVESLLASSDADTRVADAFLHYLVPAFKDRLGIRAHIALLSVLEKYYRELIQYERDRGERQDALASILEGLATSFSQTDQVRAAIEAQTQALELRRNRVSTAGSDGRNELQARLAATLAGFAHAQKQAGTLDVALRAYMESKTIFEGLVAAEPGHQSWLLGLTDTLRSLGDLQSASLRDDEALAAYQRAIDIRERVLNRAPGATCSEWLNLATGMMAAGDLESKFGRNLGAFPLYIKARRIAKLLAQKELGSHETRHVFAGATLRLAELEALRGQFGDAIELYGEAVVIFWELVEFDPDNASWVGALTSSITRWTTLVTSAGDPAEAMDILSGAIGAARRMHEDWQRPHWIEAMCQWLNLLGDLYRDGERYNEALSNYHEAIWLAERLVESHEPQVEWELQLINSLCNVANADAERGAAERAIAPYQRAIAKAERILTERAGDTALASWLSRMINNYGDVLADQQRYDEALAAYDRSLDLISRLTQVQAELETNLEWLAQLATTRRQKAKVEHRLGELEEALATNESANTAYLRVLHLVQDPDVTLQLCHSLEHRAELCLLLGRPAAALEQLSNAVSWLRPVVNGLTGRTDHVYTLASILKQMGEISKSQNETGAERLYREALGLLEELENESRLLPSWKPTLHELRTSLAPARGTTAL